jgi:adenylosuccinate synthase
LPFDITPSQVQPIYEELKGWGVDLTELRDEEHLPAELSFYISYLEERLEVPITVVSVGPDRKQTIVRKRALA